jgi:hypothetical protein
MFTHLQRQKPITINDVLYCSLIEASRQTGIPVQTIQDWSCGAKPRKYNVKVECVI